ncbi:homeodomain super [Neophaeococcomyces mojaviensis]|uniref:Homeodomain super n=1 Tax=Neophaeococcomyces mojaviensis TaxID=3383035 RepID=A0ACC3A211_9EURO|nr:homeodomain super [Knufia sp. JES_112]
MPSLSQSFEDLNFRGYNDDMLSGSSNWALGSQHSNNTASYASSNSSSQSYYNRPSVSSTRASQNLPSLNEMNLGNSPAYNSRNSQLSNLPTRSPNQYAPASYNSSPTDPLEIGFSRNGQGAYTYNTAFPGVTGSRIGYGTSQYYDSPFPDAGYYTNGTSYPPTMYSTGSNYIGSDTASIGSNRRRRGNLPKHVTDILRAWFHDHLEHPYPTDEDKQMLIQRTHLSIQQISNWFINARRRHWPALKAQRQVHNGQTRHTNSNNSPL